MDAESVSGHLLPPGSVHAFLAEHRRELFPDAMFADLFPSPLGRPSVPADVVAAGVGLAGVSGLSGPGGGEALAVGLGGEGGAGWAGAPARVLSPGLPCLGTGE